MIQETLHEVKSKIEQSDSLQPENKNELLGLIASLESEIDSVSGVDRDHPQSLHKISLEGLAARLEDSHPKLVEMINSICTSLAGLGI
jgi:uncharacterized protein DUF4404